MPFLTFSPLQCDHCCTCAQKWCHFSYFPKPFKNKFKKLRPKMTKIASRVSCLNCFYANYPTPENPICTQVLTNFYLFLSNSVKEMSLTKFQPRTTPQSSEFGKTIAKNAKFQRYIQTTFKQSLLGFHHNSLFQVHQSQTKYFRLTFRQIYLWPHHLQKPMTKTDTFAAWKTWTFDRH